MLRILKLTDYAAGLLARLARNAGERMSAQALAGEVGLPLPTVAKLLKTLTRAGLVQSTRGANGGYGLSRPAEKISLAEVIAAIEGPLALTECTAPHGKCSVAEKCLTRPHWQTVSRAVQHSLEAFSIAEMAGPRNPASPVNLLQKE
ncbi:MAG: SUF system Fe-S cluster assembly regulator [Sulfuricella sp.]|nr:SUF system Fe-S cluster assembly regulator [Sulfuricella sp.]